MDVFKFRLIYLVPGSEHTYREAFFKERSDLYAFISRYKLVTYSIHRV